MKPEGTLIVGIDFEEDFTQVSCMVNGALVPESEKIGTEKNRYRIPSVLYERPDTGEWLYGEEAYAYCDYSDGGYIGNLFTYARNNTTIEMQGKIYSAVSLFEKYLKRIIYAVKAKYPTEHIKQLAVTTKNPDKNVVNAITEALSRLDFGDDRVHVISTTDSFMYYAVNQQGDMWLNDVGLFDYDRRGLMFYSLSFGRKKKPVVVSAAITDYSEIIPPDMYETDRAGRAVYLLEEISQKIFAEHIYSTIYVMGNGFEGDWADKTLRTWCLGRRVFKGQNLYCKGACYAAFAYAQNRSDEYFFLKDDMIRGEIGMKVFIGEKEAEVTLAKEGAAYSEVNTSFDVILEDTDELAFVIRNSMKKDYVCAITSVDGIDKRERKTVRLNINLRFHDPERAIVTVRDAGFGELFPSSRRIWEYIINI